MTSIDMTSSEPYPHVHPRVPSVPATGLWQSLRALWCSHQDTFVTAKTSAMPAHAVCASCGWREPVAATMPQGTRTWDSSRDEERYQREKKRRTVVEEQLQSAVARRATPGTSPRASRGRARRSNVLELKRAVGE